LTPGTLCRSALVDRDGRLERFDYALSEWKGPPERTLGHWRCRVPASAGPQARRFDAETLMQEFERLEDSGHEQVRRLRYVLALLLLQKKRLELEDSRSEQEIDFLILVGTKGEGPFEVRDEKLDPQQIAEVQRELLAQLSSGESQSASIPVTTAVLFDESRLE
jgi:hypothetical protein